jgi:predicted nuclease with TOPRIM domain
MIKELQQRLETLKIEFEKGKEKLHEMEMQEMQLKETLLRISGAIQVLTELIEQKESNKPGSPDAQAAGNQS